MSVKSKSLSFQAPHCHEQRFLSLSGVSYDNDSAVQFRCNCVRCFVEMDQKGMDGSLNWAQRVKDHKRMQNKH